MLLRRDDLRGGMTGIKAGWRRLDRRARLAATVAGSIALHMLILGPIVLGALGQGVPLRSTGPNIIPDILIEMEPRPLLPGERPSLAAIAPPTLDPPLPRSAAEGRDAPVRTPLDDDEDLPTAPSPRAVATAPGVAVPDAPTWRIPSMPLGHRVAGSLRNGIPGCRASATLTTEERARCDERFAEAARRAPPIAGTGDAVRDVQLARQGARALAQYEAQRAPLAGSVGVVGPADCIGSNFGTGCAGAHLPTPLQQGATTNIRQRSNKLD